MKFKHRIWMLPIMTAVIIMIGIAVSSQMTSRTSSALARVEQVQYPTVEALRIVASELIDVQESLQRAVAEGDENALSAASEHAIKLRDALRELGAVDKERTLARDLGSAFEDYYSAATSATKIMLGSETGDATTAIGRMQKTNESLTAALTQAQQAAIGEFRSLLASGTDNVQRSLVASLVTAVVMMLALAVGSWVLIGSVFRSLGGEPEMAVQIVRTIASGDFTQVVSLRADDDSSLLHGIETLRQKLGTLIQDVRVTSSAVDAAAGDINSGIERLSSRTSDQAASLEETASSMEEMTVTVKRNADNARHANQLASEARDQAERGGAVASRAVTAMAEINESSRRIADIIGVIDEIAFQTNLLALNAAVEAARAGEQGRGFAVVASEVRSLAQRSATAAREIKELIQDSVSKVQDGTKLVDESGRHLTDIVSAAKKVADIIGEISAASQQQASGLDQVNGAITQMDESTQQNAAMAEETSAVAASMSEQARKLTGLITVFKIRENSGHQTVVRAPLAPPALKPAAAKPAPLASTKPALTASPQPVKKAAGSDVEWQEF
ncbi:methyl-accepting chemotaxis protein [Steroidobacter sp. S1-65]|uniref:Methyl-accepting chemotaxis protein n=1 Tax=Steroidobacter gossypii TaxID=2805490 RepID=A0ABS1X3I5_9GAMM|nr:methyl-accepting chemotaxis protein [Steroidobacter gossypii]MBM0107783.1 methyl-accepting chemotaxis protein [Steroidobacter gossypii]